MIGLGCALNFCLFWGLVSVGALISQKHGHSLGAGAGWGVLAWIASTSTYLAWRFVYDFTQRQKHPKGKHPKRDDDNAVLWFTVTIYACFAITVPLAILIARRLFSH